MQSHYTIETKTTIRCIRCERKLRVPVNKGKISVTCPVCMKEFLYDPNSILHTLRQISISTLHMLKQAYIAVRSGIARSRRNLVLFIVTVLILLLILVLSISGLLSGKNHINDSPGIRVYEFIQDEYNHS